MTHPSEVFTSGALRAMAYDRILTFPFTGGFHLMVIDVLVTLL
jgi:hypothetical protein